MQQHAAEYEKEDIVVFAICAEAVPLLGEFAAHNGITYTLLSDKTGELIRQLGILNAEVPEQDPVYGIPYPGSYLVDEQGYIFEKRFHRDFRVREPMGSLLLYFRLKEYSDRLEEKVRERTRDLERAQMQLIETARLATLGKLIAGINHELNTPVGTLASGLDVIWRYYDRSCVEAGPKERAAMMELKEAIDAACKRIIQVAAGLRQFVRLDQEETQSIDLRHCLDTVVDLLGSQLQARIVVRRDYEEIPRLLCRAPQIGQALLEVLANAAESITGEGTITLGARQVNDGVALTVSDTGRGIPPDELRRLFEPHLRSKNGRVGMSLGLPLAHKIIHEHSGRIQASSLPGQGTTVTIYLPLVTAIA